jgi:hypothetical protein
MIANQVFNNEMCTGFYCVPNAQQVHLLLTAIVFLIGITAPWFKFELYGRNIRPFVFAFLVAVGLIPFTHWLIITPAIICSYFVKASSLDPLVLLFG